MRSWRYAWLVTEGGAPLARLPYAVVDDRGRTVLRAHTTRRGRYRVPGDRTHGYAVRLELPPDPRHAAGRCVIAHYPAALGGGPPC